MESQGFLYQSHGVTGGYGTMADMGTGSASRDLEAIAYEGLAPAAPRVVRDE